MKKQCQSLKEMVRAELKRRAHSRKIKAAYEEVKLALGRSLSLADEYWFKGGCASLLESIGHIPRGFVIESIRLARSRESLQRNLHHLAPEIKQ